MRIHRKVLIACFAVVAAVAGASPALAIRGGTESPRPYSFAGSLQRPDSPRSDGHVCGVTLIAPQWALTAGHCTRNPSGAQVGTPRDWTVRIGSVSTTSGGQVAAVDTFYAYSADPVREGDIALLHLETPVDAIPAALPVARPADHTPIRIVGWGMTCGQMQPRCFPDHLREADTEIQPAKLCERSGIAADRDLCIGSEDGSVAATNMDSGGPALVRTGESWTIVGTVSGSNGDDQPVVYTDVHHYADWIAGVLDGSAVPPESPVPDLEGAVALGGCSASVVRTASASPSDPALLLTNGHCVPQPPAPGKAVADLPMSVPVSIGDHQGYPQTTAHTTRLVYATMTGTDVALFRLDKTYAQLGDEGAKVFELATTPARPGTRVGIVSAGTGDRYACTIDALIPHLREDGYQQDDSYRYDAACGTTHGASGSPLVLDDGTTIVGVHGTGNDSGERCTANNPCEVAEDGTVRVEEGRRYGQRTTMLPACLTAGSRLDMAKPGCTLPHPRVLS